MKKLGIVFTLFTMFTALNAEGFVKTDLGRAINKVVAYNKNMLGPTYVWEEGKADEGIGEWVIIPVEDEDAYAQQYRMGDIDKINIRFCVFNGFQKTIDLYKKNNRVKDAKISIYAVPYGFGMNYAYITANPELVYEKAVTLSDEIIENPIYLNWSEFKFSFDLPDQYKDGTPDRHYLYQFYLKLEIQSVYKGSKYNDTCISEMYATLEKEF